MVLDSNLMSTLWTCGNCQPWVSTGSTISKINILMMWFSLTRINHKLFYVIWKIVMHFFKINQIFIFFFVWRKDKIVR